VTRDAARTAGIPTAGASKTELTAEQLQQIEKLKTTDAEVRMHEAAHLAAAGPYAKGGAEFTYETGPDGNRYATGGEVSIDISPIPGDPEGTIEKARQVRQAALAPARPSAQDRSVAAAAMQMELKARQQLNEQKSQEVQGDATSSETAQAAGGAESESPKRETSPEQDSAIAPGDRLEDWPEFSADLRPTMNNDRGIRSPHPRQVAATYASLEREESAPRPAQRQSEMNEQVRNPAASGPASPTTRIKTDPAVVASAFQSTSNGPRESRFGAVA
jgi:hypothetical protein